MNSKDQLKIVLEQAHRILQESTIAPEHVNNEIRQDIIQQYNLEDLISALESHNSQRMQAASKMIQQALTSTTGTPGEEYEEYRKALIHLVDKYGIKL